MTRPTTKKPAFLKIGHGNGHNEESLVNMVKSVKADSFGCDETQRLLGKLDKIPNTRLISPNEGTAELRNRALSTSIVTSNRHANLGELHRQVSERIPSALRVAPDRMLIASFFEHPLATKLGFEGVAHFELHPDAGPEQLNGHDAKAAIVREYRESLTSTTRHMRTARADGLLPILTGDLQMRVETDRPWSPGNLIAKRLGLKVWATKIDWILFDSKLELAARPITRKLHDHSGFVARLGAA